MEERILEILKTLVAMKSVSCSTAEVEPAEWFAGFFETLPYFEKHPEDTGLYEIPGDPYGRKIPYAFLKGKKTDTVLLSGHFDVVSTEEYGKAEPWAYEVLPSLRKCCARCLWTMLPRLTLNPENGSGEEAWQT